jgi:hypothetical protein
MGIMIKVLKQALEALEEYSWQEGATRAANLAINSLNQAIANLEKQEPYGWAYESHGRFTCNAHPIFWKTRKAETYKEDFWEEIPLYRHPSQCQEPVMIVNGIKFSTSME